MASSTPIGFADAGTLSLNGTWKYSDSDSADSSTFTQGYIANYIGSTDLTELVRLSGSMRYSRSIEDNGDTTDRLSPALSLNNKNDIYRLNLSGNYNVTWDENDFQSDNWSWNSFISNSWTTGILRPDISIYYGQSGRFNDDRDGTRNDRSGATISYGYWQWIQLGYGVNLNKTKDKDSNSESKSLVQTASLRASKSLFDDRIGLTFSQLYQEQDRDFTVRADEEGTALVPLFVTQASYEETDDPVEGALTNDASFLLSDADQPPTTLVVDPANEPMNLGVQTDFKQVDVLYLTTEDDISSYANEVGWDLYSSSNGDDWTLEEANLLFVYDSREQRFEFEFDSQVHRYLKLVADTDSLLPLQIIEIDGMELYRLIIGEEGETIRESNDSTNYQTNFGLSYDVTDDIMFNYNFNYSDNDEERSADTQNTSNHASLSWNIHEHLTARANTSRSKQEVDDQPDTLSKFYALSLSSEPLPTLNVTFGFNRNENEPDDAPDQTTHVYSIFTTAELYHDLDGSLSLGYSTVEEGEGDDSLGARLRLTARLRPTLLLGFENDYNYNIDSGDYSNNSLVTFNWRASELLSLNNGFTGRWQSEKDAAYSYRLSVNLTPNLKNRISANYRYAHEESENTHGVGADWQWLINRIFNFQLGGNYANNEDGSSWAFFARLSGRYRNN